jgi:prepilin-type N-terminal cleavage/methylation domain-containing protein
MIARARGGFTLIETVFAIFIFAVGALALAGTTTIVIRTLAEAGARERATRIATNRLETLRGLSCGSAHGGGEAVQGVQSTWTVSPSGGLSSATVTVTYPIGNGPRTERYSLLFPCLP